MKKFPQPSTESLYMLSRLSCFFLLYECKSAMQRKQEESSSDQQAKLPYQIWLHIKRPGQKLSKAKSHSSQKYLHMNCLWMKLFWKLEGNHYHKRKDVHFASQLSEAKLPNHFGNGARWANEGNQKIHLVPYQRSRFCKHKRHFWALCFYYIRKHRKEYITKL